MSSASSASSASSSLPKRLLDENDQDYENRAKFYKVALKHVNGNVDRATSLSMLWRNVTILGCRYSAQVEKVLLDIDPTALPKPKTKKPPPVEMQRPPQAPRRPRQDERTEWRPRKRHHHHANDYYYPSTTYNTNRQPYSRSSTHRFVRTHSPHK